MQAASKKVSVIILAGTFFLLDRLIKLIFKGYYRTTEFKLIGDWFKLKLAYNSGIAFGLPINSWLIIGVTLIIIIILISIVIKTYRQEGLGLLTAWVFLLAGAVSNLADRLHYGMVIDYLDLQYFTVFNLSDIAITLSIAYLLVKLTFTKSILPPAPLA